MTIKRKKFLWDDWDTFDEYKTDHLVEENSYEEIATPTLETNKYREKEIILDIIEPEQYVVEARVESFNFISPTIVEYRLRGDVMNGNAYEIGSSIYMEVSNRPYLDTTISPELNDYHWASEALIKIFSPTGEKIYDGTMFKDERIGWYKLIFKTDNLEKGAYKVAINLRNEIDPLLTKVVKSDSSDYGDYGDYGDDYTNIVDTIEIKHFTLR